jgi:hypothetical protein
MQEISKKEENNTEAITNFLTDMKQNVGDNERLVSAIAGSGLITYGISKGGLFGTALSLVGGGLLYRGATGHCHLYSAVDKTTAEDASTRVHVQKSVTINKSQAELYQFWRNFENLPQFMNHLESVTVLDSESAARLFGRMGRRSDRRSRKRTHQLAFGRRLGNPELGRRRISSDRQPRHGSARYLNL